MYDAESPGGAVEPKVANIIDGDILNRVQVWGDTNGLLHFQFDEPRCISSVDPTSTGSNPGVGAGERKKKEEWCAAVQYF